ncbi:MAG: SapC family protein, partial [Alphaproteobacteria bacterium]
KDSLAPAVLLGLADGANFYVDDDGNWSEGYKPAFVRMYPFVLANKGEDEFAVCVDEGFEGLNEDDGERLFDDEGKESEGLQNAIKFLTQYQGEMRRTGNIMKTLSELDLLAERTVQIKKPDGTQTNLKGIYAIDEAKLNALDDEKVVELFRNGTMACIFAHLLSLRNLARLTRKLDKGQAAESSEGQTIN